MGVDLVKVVRIEAYTQGEPEATIKIPLTLLKVAAHMFPKKRLEALERNAISFEDLLQLAQSPEVSGTLIEIEDHKSGERLVISLE